MADLRGFAKRILSLGKGVEVNAVNVVRKVGLAVDAAVVIATPVDTGRARSNWQVALNAAPTGTRSAYSEGTEGSTAGPNAQAAIDQGKEVISTCKSGQTIHITNNLPYIGRLNNGHSAQAPSGFVEKAVLVGVAAIQNSGGLLKPAGKEP